MSQREREHTAESLIDVYDQLYRIQGKKQHPRKVRNGKLITLGRYGDAKSRNSRFTEFIGKHVPAGASIHDAGCGRGYILRSLVEMGYDATGSDCAASLFFQELRDLNAKKVDYADLRVFGEDRFDVVISNDVLEHLVDEDAVAEAIANLAFITKDWLLISVGTGRARNYPSTHRNLDIVDLHRVRRAGGWWRKQITPHMDVVATQETKVNWYQFGRKSRP